MILLLEILCSQEGDNIMLWAPLLYKVYLALNRGKKFAEIEAVVNK